jgi:hypothetical protein
MESIGTQNGAITLVTTAETVVCQTPFFSNNVLTGQGVKLEATVNATAGTGTANFVIRIRQTDINGSVVMSTTDSIGAGSARTVTFIANDTSPLAGTVDYVLTISQTSASGNGTANKSTLVASIVQPPS